MIYFFESVHSSLIAVDFPGNLDSETQKKLEWLFGKARLVPEQSINGQFIGPRKEMITPWSTNAVEITQNMGIAGIVRIEEFIPLAPESHFDSMLQRKYDGLTQEIFAIYHAPDPIEYIENIEEYNKQEGLALNTDEVAYLNELSQKLGRKLTDSEIFGFSQVNSEHCRHKIFNGTFVIDGEEKPYSLFKLIRQTTEANPNRVISAYKDNCAFIDASNIEMFVPQSHHTSDFFTIKEADSVISIKAETHNFPTTVEPFNGAATGSGGEIRDRIAGGKAAFPIAGTAVYMTAYTRLENPNRAWEQATQAREWLYQTPKDILIKASNGASDFGNKFGQPLICGSVLTFEHFENNKKYAFDKVIMMAGGIGFAKKIDSLKDDPQVGDNVVLLGGDNYRIGMGGGAVSSVATGEYNNAIELNAVQRSNPEMQKRAYNAIRALGEMDKNPVISIHDHGAGGHLNCLSELVESTGGTINIDALPVGDPTLSAKEIVGNESQERMGLVLRTEDVPLLQKIAERERAPMYVIGKTTGTHQFTFINNKTGEKPIDLTLEDMFGNPPKTILNDSAAAQQFAAVETTQSEIENYLNQVLQLESVACKDYLTNKVDRSVTGRVATQQCCGELQLPLNNCGVVTLDFQGKRGIATAIGHAPAAAMISAAHGSILAIAESLTNIVFAPIEGGLQGISLSANWMWACKNEGEDARLYEAVEAASDFAKALKINIPTGKDSLSMTQKYPNGDVVYAPGTVIITSVGEVTDIKKTVEPVLKPVANTVLVYVDFGKSGEALGGSALAQILNKLGTKTPSVSDPRYFAKAFAAIQTLVAGGKIYAGHDVSSGGLLTCLAEMCFANTTGGAHISIKEFKNENAVAVLFNENPALVIQIDADTVKELEAQELSYTVLGSVQPAHELTIETKTETLHFSIDDLRTTWYTTSYLLDCEQSGEEKALERFENHARTPLTYTFPKQFSGKLAQYNVAERKVNAAIIREKGSNGDREMAWCLYAAGFNVKDVHMTDLISGRETLEDIQMIVFVGGFSNSDVLGSAKGWAGAFLYNEKAKHALDNFYARPDTMSLGVCNGCQLMIELGLVNPTHAEKPHMGHNDSHKFESNFTSVAIHPTSSIMLKSLENSTLGIWIAHGEGKFNLPYDKSKYQIAMTYGYESYPANPNGSDYNAAGIVSDNGRHLVMMPHLERSLYAWSWAHYDSNRAEDEVSPWIEAFVNARLWLEKQ
ncbi:MAG: phosphoribosylformylglycinamidine synthase [Bacteroidales bacterium]|jgi:phosphoribosylformylglycinamidine synthase|nr:phosphoribosylformylglycinamidine synthase [Bacteroidales bacterium]